MPQGTCFPPRLRAFVRAAALEPVAARAAWSTWQRLNVESLLQPSEEQLAATVYANLTRAGISTRELTALAPVAERIRMLSRLRAPAYRRIAERLTQAGIEPLLLKGLALAGFYPDPCARRPGDLDLLVPEQQHATALGLLRTDGWEFARPADARFDSRFLHAVQLLDARNLSIDLHCHLLPVSCCPGIDRIVWERAAAAVLDGVHVQTLSPTDHLLHIAVHGQIAAVVRPVRWLVDAAMILRQPHGTVDWDRLVRVARHLHVTSFLLAAFGELRDTLDLVPPPGVMTTLADTRRLAAERLLRRATSRMPRGPVNALALHCGRFLHGTRHVPPIRRAALIPAYLRAWVGVDNWVRMLGEITWRIGRSIAVRLRLASPSVQLNPRTMGANPGDLKARLDASGRWTQS